MEAEREKGIESEKGSTYQTEIDRRSESSILRIVLDLGISEEEGHCEEGADDHCACNHMRIWTPVCEDSSLRLTSATPEPTTPTHQPRQYRAGDAASVGDGIVTPLFVLAQTAELSTAGT